MEKMIDLKDLLKHEVLDLYSAEEQIIEAMPSMIDKAKDPSLKKALSEHLRITEKQKSRLDKVKQMLNEEAEEEGGEKKKGFLSGLFGGGKQTCKGMEGLISEGEKVMGEDMSTEVLDAAIIASAQKIEHYEICGYGTARAYARELNLGDVAELLEETLDEEYEADDKLTDLAVGRINEEAEEAKGSSGRRTGNGHPGKKRAGRDDGVKRTNGEKKSPSRGSNGSSAGKKNSGRNSSSKAVRSSTGRSTKSNGSSRGTSKGKTKTASSRGR